MRAGLSDVERDEVQIRYSAQGGDGLSYYSDYKDAWETFIRDPNAWKISWTGKNGKRIRITKESPNIFKFNYVEDMMEGIVRKLASEKL